MNNQLPFSQSEKSQTEAFSVTDKTRIKRAPQRAVYDKETVYQILDEALLCHVAFTWNEAPALIPTIHWRIDNHLYLHGASKSRLMQHLASGIPACISVALVDGLVLARSAFHHSMNYRSVVIFGCGRSVEDPAKKENVLARFVEHVIPGRGADVRPANPTELKATRLIEFDLLEVSAKIRRGEPKDDSADMGLDVWAGTIPLKLTAGEPVTAEDSLVSAPPAYTRNYQRDAVGTESAH
ncbi:pyridoxamine 5'-phosphate oxidase family protein [Acanthopleuribacter pedis]|uniref:Pyridoxamine 5'-phosphate oxidase family protein n=1 Tax=Acanthopleuribacter pedis TaxID=442870 RepID=A0A8J7Q793_9BACT|nr:pyridoxamine 5'-phosphate oxidase family protein [Acanthopleuribacter pedis]MBO1318064.1 pyridoxamine 5'-phosphate oxidase family protein [Acanthopleuribacter pedis]